ncbi:hypothetical protein D9M72_372460 [compost metagenome]
MPRAKLITAEGGNRRQLQDRLGNPAPGVGDDALAQRVEFLLGRIGPDDQALAAGPVHRFDHQFIQPVQDVLPRLFLLQPERVHVRDHGLFVEVVADEVRHIAVDELVVSHAVAHGIGDGHASGTGRIHQARAAQHGIGPELQRIEEVVVDPLVDDVNALFAGGGPHVHPVAAADQVTALHKFNAHETGKQRVLEICAVEHAGGKDHYRGVVDAGGCRLAQGGKQPARVLLHRTDQLLAEGLRQALGHGPAVFQDVADTGRHAHVVFEHPECSRSVTDDVDARDVDADSASRLEPMDLAVEVGTGGDELARNDAVSHHGHLVVDIVEEGLEGADPLGHALLQDGPFVGRDHAGDDNQRKRAFLPCEVEGDTAVQEGPGHRIGPGGHIGERKFTESPGDLPVGLPGFLAGGEHLVVGTGAAGGLGVILE